ESAGALPWLARSRYELALTLAARGGNGDAERAGRLLAEASRTAEQLGMDALLERMRSGRRRASRPSRLS
ncbi:MAG TPA: hypothetical protein VG518_09605, partial [Solirubrobacterales bacterium]|nr:hypothetical protein [Solirubrobacterales bacterium]